MKNPTDESRRNFLLGLACFSASAAISQVVGCSRDSHPQPSPAKAAHVTPAQPFRVAIQGSFAIFVSKQNIIAYVPDVGTHRYCISDGDYKTCDLGKFGPDLNTLVVSGGTDLVLDGVTPANTPVVFGTSAGSNVINTDVNPVLKISDVKRPEKYLYRIILPIPTSVSSWCMVGKDYGEFFVNPPLVLKDLSRVHVFEYADYDLGGLMINKTPIQLSPGDTHIKILSEPFSQTGAVSECKKHVQRANDAIAGMIQLKTGIKINEGYCTSITPLDARKKGWTDGNGDGDGPGSPTFSRLPACMTMFVDDTATGPAATRT